MIGRLSTVIGCALVVACGKDVQLGVGPDAELGLDAPQGVFIAGSYALSFIDPFDISCEGSLTGSEPSFSTLTRASTNLVDGPVTLTMPGAGVLAISGTPISTAMGQATVNLVPNPSALPPDFPQTIWDASVMTDFGAGPSGTLHNARYIGVDSASAANPSAMEAAMALLYETPDTTGLCYLSIRAVLASQ